MVKKRRLETIFESIKCRMGHNVEWEKMSRNKVENFSNMSLQDCLGGVI
jgi:hypothetical protein